MSDRIDHTIRLGFRVFLQRIWKLMKHPIFITVTIVGNTWILLGTALLYYFEHDVNHKLQTVLDAIWWAVATVSTVGYGDISPVTPAGKVVGIGMMIVGTALFSTYTALFAGALVSTEISDIEKGVKGIERRFEGDEQALHDVIRTVETALADLHKLRTRKSDENLHRNPKSGA